MSPPALFLLFLLLPLRGHPAAPVTTEFLYPNFTASSVNYIDRGGIFLTSSSSTFSATLSSSSPQSPFVFSLIHSPTSTVIWSANPAAPAPHTAAISLSAAGLSISFSNGSLLWSTPPLPRPAAALRLLDSGNLLLLDDVNASLWQSFEHPTDTLLSSQRLPAGASLSTPAGDYRLLIADDDAVLQWTRSNQKFWSLSADPRSVKDVNDVVSYLAADVSAISLFSAAGRALHIVSLPQAELRIMRLESGGRFRIMGYSGNGSILNEQFAAPSGVCDLPLSCKALEVCTVKSVGATCNCPASFTASSGGGCSQADSSALASLSSCGRAGENREVEPSYLSLESGVEYFANKFTRPASSGGDISSCRSLCTGNCSCLGFFYQNSSKSCFLINDQLGSLHSPNNKGAFDSGRGYIKTLASAQPQSDSTRGSNLIPILLPFIVVLLILLFAGIYWQLRRRHQRQQLRRKRTKVAYLREIHVSRNKPWQFPAGARGSSGDSSDDSDEISIPSLPNRFTYAELTAATDNFSTKIGSGGFGEVFKGVLPDHTVVAVKRISAGASRIKGKEEFCTEITIIGSVRHVNLVRLRGFCAEGRRRRLLVYEYMNRGSLDQSLFVAGDGPVLEWQERMAIAVGAARGLAYLHSCCDRKIVHCDVKPENILLHNGGSVKISDFGLAKLMSPEQSGFFTTMRGTRGYLAPEWLTNSPISDRTDVYSYGMVLLEIIRGKKNWLPATECLPSRSSGVEMVYFPLAALEMHERGRYLELADPRLEGRVAEKEVGRAVKVALCCLHEEPAVRPTMVSVAAMLDGTMEVARPRSEVLGFLRLYGRGCISSGGNGTTTSSSLALYSHLSSQQVSGPR